MATNFPYLEIPPELTRVIGERDGASRVYRKRGSQEESAAWFDAITQIVGPTVSPGGVGMYCPVSRAAVYKRIKEGKLSSFNFFVTEKKTKLFGGLFVAREMPYSFIPVSEAQAWRSELEKRAIAQGKVTREELEGSKPDWDGFFLEWNLRWATSARLSLNKSSKQNPPLKGRAPVGLWPPFAHPLTYSIPSTTTSTHPD